MHSDEDSVTYTEKTYQKKLYVGRRIRLAHFSVQEYLESTRILGSNAKIFHLRRNKEEQFLSDCCVAYLLNYASSDRMTRTRKDLKTFPLLQYAARFWYKHCQEIDNVDRQARLLYSQPSVECWIKVHDPISPVRRPFETGVFGPDLSWSGLYYAAATNLPSVVEVLIGDYNIDINTKGGQYGSALQVASLLGHEQIVRILLENQADVNIQGGSHGSALHAASRRGHEHIVGILLENKADVNIRGGLYGSAL